MDPKAVMFDLDMTLVDSSRLQDDRVAGLWSRVFARLDEVQAFPSKRGPEAHTVPGWLKEDGKAIAVVTSSPRKYAEEVISKFGIKTDVLIAYQDTAAHKPDPEPLEAAMQQLGIPPAECLYVGDDPMDAEAAYHANVISVGALWRFPSARDPRQKAFFRAAPDIPLRNPGMLLLPENMANCRYAGEAVIAGLPFHPHDGCRLHWRETDGVVVECLGRYFNTEDVRNASSPWTGRILYLKNHPEASDVFTQAVAEFLKSSPYKPDLIVPIPPKPGSQNRFLTILATLPTLLPGSYRVVADGLICDRAIDNYKGLSHVARAAAISGSISSKYDWSGQRILLLDDVVTSGSTTRECTKVLREDGAAEVRVLAFGFSQDSFTGKTCSRCGRSMRVRNGQYGKFWGCSGFPAHCDNTENLAPHERTA